MKSKVLTVQHLDVAVEDRILINDLSFNVYGGALTCVTGENGVGKTTLVKALLKHKRNSTKQVHFLVRPDQVQYVPQFRNVDDDYPLKIKDFVSLSLQNSFLPWLTKSEKDRIENVLKITKLTEIENEPLGRASGGQKQRAYLAQALVTDPKLLILDETTASLDKQSRVYLLQVVVDIIKRTGAAVMFITHDPELINRFGDYDLEIANHHGEMHRVKGGQA
ncbi:ATP-binding cassette domain-containing protein [Nicoliella spurrieriana]|uniref:ATP-binding cassette domain-containing protein n=1 Tax=Nicoliella spurrieriana TaxID=2925830 RepID=A0A976X610_9LACO|nr:ATP-binding cassette domain-containing protein [Nicoliella spurrieriana]UQS87211.1 ATP-binding cassette domain-containing protein [Nicoliella spurrieriana]